MDIETLRDKCPAFFEAFPEALIKFSLSEKTAQKIANICVEHKVSKKEDVEEVASKIIHTIFGELKKEELVSVLENSIEAQKSTVESIAQRADEIIFSQIPAVLEEDDRAKEEEKEREVEKPVSMDPENSKKDTYREPIE